MTTQTLKRKIRALEKEVWCLKTTRDENIAALIEERVKMEADAKGLRNLHTAAREIVQHHVARFRERSRMASEVANASTMGSPNRLGYATAAITWNAAADLIEKSLVHVFNANTPAAGQLSPEPQSQRDTAKQP